MFDSDRGAPFSSATASPVGRGGPPRRPRRCRPRAPTRRPPAHFGVRRLDAAPPLRGFCHVLRGDPRPAVPRYCSHAAPTRVQFTELLSACRCSAPSAWSPPPRLADTHLLQISRPKDAAQSDPSSPYRLRRRPWPLRPGPNANTPYDSWPRTFHDKRHRGSLPPPKRRQCSKA